VNAGERISLSILGTAERRLGWLIVNHGLDIELDVEGSEPIPSGTLVEFQTDRAIYLGEVQSSGKSPAGQSLCVRLAHELDLDRVAAIRRAWNAEPLG
jgi:hypothetical protein